MSPHLACVDSLFGSPRCSIPTRKRCFLARSCLRIGHLEANLQHQKSPTTKDQHTSEQTTNKQRKTKGKTQLSKETTPLAHGGSGVLATEDCHRWRRFRETLYHQAQRAGYGPALGREKIREPLQVFFFFFKRLLCFLLSLCFYPSFALCLHLWFFLYCFIYLCVSFCPFVGSSFLLFV